MTNPWKEVDNQNRINYFDKSLSPQRIIGECKVDAKEFMEFFINDNNQYFGQFS